MDSDGFWQSRSQAQSSYLESSGVPIALHSTNTCWEFPSSALVTRQQCCAQAVIDTKLRTYLTYLEHIGKLKTKNFGQFKFILNIWVHDILTKNVFHRMCAHEGTHELMKNTKKASKNVQNTKIEVKKTNENDENQRWTLRRSSKKVLRKIPDSV